MSEARDKVRIACLYKGETSGLVPAEDALCHKCSQPISYSPESIAYARRKHAGFPIELWCIGCAGVEFKNLSEADLEAARAISREQIGWIADLVSNDVVRDLLRRRAKQ